MSTLLEPEQAHLQPEAVLLLAAIRDHLNLPLPTEQGTKVERRQARGAYRSLLEVRHADVVAALNELLAVPVVEAAQCAADLRRFAAGEPVDYPTAGGESW